MEKIEKILDFIKDIGDGDGYGDCSGSGYSNDSGDGSGNGDGNDSGCGSGFSSGSGCGSGSGDGSGDSSGYGSYYGHGDGSGNGYGNDGDGDGDGDLHIITKIDNEQVFYLDGVPTIIDNVRGNIATGRIINETNYTQTKCYIAKGQGKIAHEKTLREAVKALQQKILADMNIEQRLEMFRDKFSNKSKYKGETFFKWHNILTGSCLAGRTNFVKSRGLSLDKKYSVEEFISICENAYGGDIIKQLKKYYKEK